MTNADLFTGRVESYERYRMRYPATVLESVRERCGLRATDLVADIGAGTGMLAELFLAAGNRVVAVEPNAEMRAACGRLAALYAGLRVLDATAEATTLGSGSVDLVSVGRAFHWFDQQLALAEFKRILKPGGWVVLVSNRRADKASALMREYEGLLRAHGNHYDELHGHSRSPVDLRLYAGEHFCVAIPGEQRLTFEELVGQTESYSAAPRPGEPGSEALRSALRDLFTRWSTEGLLHLQTICEIAGWQTPRG